MFQWILNRNVRTSAQAHALGERLRREGNALLAQGALQEAELCYRQAVAADPEVPSFHISLGFVLMQMQRWDEAQTELNKADNIDANNADCHYMLAELAERRLDFEKAAEHFQLAFELNVEFELACRDACRVLFMLGRIDDCRTQLIAGLALNPLNGDFHFYQGNLHLTEKNADLALESYRKALSLGADHAALHCFIGRILQQKGEIEAARRHMTRSIELDPSLAEAHHGLGVVNYHYGYFDQAIADQRNAIALDPSLLHAHTCLLFGLSFTPGCSPQQYLRQARIFGDAARLSASPPLPPANTLHHFAERRPLRIGWVSGDFRFHPVASFLEGILTHLAKEPLVLIAFSNNPQNDAVTDRLRGLMTEWHDIWGMSDFDAASLIRSLQVDVLIDLSGHTSHTRLPVFAWRPAPTQVSWMGYFASTGLAEIDFFLADEYSVPQEWTPYFSERIWHLPETRLCMTAPQGVELPVGYLPSQSAGFVTFGCFQALGKINDAVLGAWSKIMARLPNSRLRIQVRNLDYPGVRSNLIRRLEDAGIEQVRVSLYGRTQYQSYLEAHGEVDMILDTFPYPGGATTADALWMGVPTVTIKGESLLARQGASILHTAGLGEWIADNEAQYIDLAVERAQDIGGLAELRCRLRQQALASPLFDGQRFANSFLVALHKMHEERARSAKSI